MWLDYELEETQTKLDVVDLVIESLVEEGVTFLAKIECKHNY